MIKIEKLFGGGFNLTTTLNSKHVNFSHLVADLCSQVDGIEVLGKQVDENRECFLLVQYEGKTFYSNGWSGYGSDYILEFREFSGQLENMEPLHNYCYVIDYCNPEINNEECFYYYFKKDELKEAKKLQEKLDPGLAFLREI